MNLKTVPSSKSRPIQRENCAHVGSGVRKQGGEEMGGSRVRHGLRCQQLVFELCDLSENSVSATVVLARS